MSTRIRSTSTADNLVRPVRPVRTGANYGVGLPLRRRSLHQIRKLRLNQAQALVERLILFVLIAENSFIHRNEEIGRASCRERV